MTAATMTPRASAGVAAELAQRKARQAELTDRLALTNADLHAKRGARARALAEGKKAPGAAEVAALAEECDGITAALTLLAEDVTTLQGEGQAAQLAEAEEAQSVAIEHAERAVAELDTTLRRAFASSVAPASDAFSAMMIVARSADDELDRLQRRASTKELPILPGKSERVLRSRMVLLGVVASLRSYVDGHRERAE